MFLLSIQLTLIQSIKNRKKFEKIKRKYNVFFK